MSKSRVFLIAAVATLLFVVFAATGAEKKLTDLTALVQADWATSDVFAVVDVSANSTKKTTVADFDARYFNETSVATVAQGGTGIASGTSGGVLAFSASGTIVSSGQLAQSQVVIGGGSGAAPSTLAAGSQYQVLRMGASVPAYGSINLDQAAAVTGVLPNANTTATSANTNSAIVLRDTAGNFNAGTISAAVSGNASTSTALAANPSDCGADTYATTIAASGNLTCSTVSNAGLAGSIAASKLVGTDIATLGTITSGTWTATAISAAYGGTGASTLTANNVILGNGTNPVAFVAPGTSGNVLTSNGTTWTSAAASGGGGGTSEWYVDAVLEGGNPDLGVAAVSAYSEIVSGTFTLTPDSGSAAVGVMCSSANAATAPSTSATTCAAGNESMGINFDITTPGTGVYEVCVYFAHVMVLDAEDGIRDYFQLIETPTDAQTHTTLGRTKQGSGHQHAVSGGTDTIATLSVSNCSLFRWASAGVKGIRLKYQQTVNSAPDSNIIYGDASSSHGDRNIRWTVQKYGRY